MEARSNKQTLFVGMWFLLFSITLTFSYIITNEEFVGIAEHSLGFLLMLGSLMLVILVLNNKWSSSIGVLVLIMLFLYHGVGELLYILFADSGQSDQSIYIEPQSLATATMLAGIGMFFFAIGYAAVTIRITKYDRHQRLADSTHTDENGETWHHLLRVNMPVVLIWTILAILFRGGANNSVELNSSGDYWASTFFVDMYPPLITLFLLVLKAKHKNGDLSSALLVIIIIAVLSLTVILGNIRQDIAIIMLVFVFMSAKLGR